MFCKIVQNEVFNILDIFFCSSFRNFLLHQKCHIKYLIKILNYNIVKNLTKKNNKLILIKKLFFKKVKKRNIAV